MTFAVPWYFPGVLFAAILIIAGYLGYREEARESENGGDGGDSQ